MKPVLRTALINLRVTPEEREAAETAAAEMKLDLSEYVRLMLFNRQPVGSDPPERWGRSVPPTVSVTITGPIYVGGGRELEEAEVEGMGVGVADPETEAAVAEAESGDRGRLLSVEEVADRLGTGVRFPRRLIAERRIRYVKIGNHVRIPESAVEEFIEQGEVR